MLIFKLSPPLSQKITPYLFYKLAKYCLLTILFFFPFINSSAQTVGDQFTVGDFIYTVTDATAKTVSIKATNNNISGDISIPEEITDSTTDITYSVTSIGRQAFYGSGLTNITIPDFVTTMDDEVFYNCKSLASVTIGNSVTRIPYQTFWGCSSLTSVTIPASVTSMGGNAFRECSSLTSVTFQSNNPPTLSSNTNVFYGILSTTTFYVPNTSYLSAGIWSTLLIRI